MKVKKLLLIGGIGVLGLALVGGIPVMKKQLAYAKQGIQAWADENTDPQKEIKRLKEEVAQLGEQENEIKDALAKEIYQCERLDAEKNTLVAALPKEEERVRDLHAAIKEAGDNSKVSVSGRSFNMSEALKRLDAESRAVQARQNQLAAVTTEYDRHVEFKGVLRSQLDEVRAARRELTSELDTLALEFRTLELQGMKNKTTADNNKLSEVRQSVEKLKEKLSQKRIRNGLDTEERAADAPTALDADKMLERINGNNGN